MCTGSGAPKDATSVNTRRLTVASRESRRDAKPLSCYSGHITLVNDICIVHLYSGQHLPRKFVLPMWWHPILMNQREIKDGVCGIMMHLLRTVHWPWCEYSWRIELRTLRLYKNRRHWYRRPDNALIWRARTERESTCWQCS